MSLLVSILELGRTAHAGGVGGCVPVKLTKTTKTA